MSNDGLIISWTREFSFPTERVSYFSGLTELLASVKTQDYSKSFTHSVFKTDPILMTFPQ